MEWKKINIEQPENGEAVIAYNSQNEKAVLAYWSNGSLPLKRGFWETDGGYKSKWTLFYSEDGFNDDRVFWMRIPKIK